MLPTSADSNSNRSAVDFFEPCEKNMGHTYNFRSIIGLLGFLLHSFTGDLAIKDLSFNVNILIGTQQPRRLESLTATVYPNVTRNPRDTPRSSAALSPGDEKQAAIMLNDA